MVADADLSRLEPDDAASVETSDDVADHEALRFLIRTGQLGETISAGMAARIGDREVIGNLTVILIAHLYLHGSRRPVEIQEITGLSSGGVTKLLDRMEGLGLIARAHGQVSADRRAITVDLTDDGTRMARLLAAGLMDRISDVRMTLRELAGAADGVAERADAGRRSVAAEPGPGRTGPATARRSRNSNDRSGSR